MLPRIRLHITPTRTYNGSTIDWSGRISGGPYPADGVALLVEVREGSRWQPFDEVVAVDGRFAYRYTFLRTTEPTSYRFRVALPASGSSGYDYRRAAATRSTCTSVEHRRRPRSLDRRSRPAALTLTAADLARAGTYGISNCPAAGNANAGSWTVFGSPQADSATCGGGPAHGSGRSEDRWDRTPRPE